MVIKCLFIGDPHFKITNMVEVEKFIIKMLELVKEKNPNIVIIGGDLLHTHERLHTLALNKAYEFVDKIREICKTYILVGNHDMCNNSQFLTTNHWMNGMKKWKNVSIVDKTILINLENKKFVLVPYVPNGRFIEALNVLNEDWKDVDCIFAHQEFNGCKMGAVVSTEGDVWSTEFPNVISGHIHSKQTPQKNIYYPGSAMQHAFGESEKNIIAYLEFKKDIKNYVLEEINLNLPRKKIIYINTEELETYKIPKSEDKIKLTVSGNYQEFKSIKKTKKYKKLIDQGVKIVFKPKKIEDVDGLNSSDVKNFNTILDDLILKENNTYLTDVYKLIIKNT